MAFVTATLGNKYIASLFSKGIIYFFHFITLLITSRGLGDCSKFEDTDFNQGRRLRESKMALGKKIRKITVVSGLRPRQR